MENRPKRSIDKDHQVSTYVLDLRLSEGRARRNAAKRYARDYEIPGLSRRQQRRQALAYLRSPEGPFDDVALTDPVERKKIDAIHDEFLGQEYKRLDNKGSYSNMDTAGLIFRANSNRTGLGKDESVQMYEEAGYSEQEIKAITGKQVLSSAVVMGGLVGVSEGGRLAATVHENLIPFLDRLPARHAGMGAVASIVAYTATYARFTAENVRSTRDTGVSGNALVTGIYAKTRLLPSHIRERAAGMIPFISDFALHTAFYTAVIEGTTGDPKKVIAANVVGIGLTNIFTEASKAVRRHKAKKDKSEDKNVIISS